MRPLSRKISILEKPIPLKFNKLLIKCTTFLRKNPILTTILSGKRSNSKNALFIPQLLTTKVLKKTMCV
jgi:hypothetical protein